MLARIQVLFARSGPELIGCIWVGVALLVLNFLGHSWHFHGDCGYNSFLRVYGWPTVWAWRLEFYDFGSSGPSEVGPLRDVNLQAAMIDAVASLVLLAGTYYTVRTLRLRAKRFQFSLRALLTFTFVVAGVCGFLVADHRATEDLVFKPEWYVPATALPLYLSLPMISGIASVLWAAGAIVCRSMRALKMSSGFWAGGPEAYEEGLKQHFDAQLAVLHDRLCQCTTDAQREAIRQEIKAVEKQFQDKIREIDRLIF